MRHAAAVGTLVILAFTSAEPTPPARAQGSTGIIEGLVTFDGTPPPPTVVIQDGGSQQVLYVNRSGGLRYALVFLPDARPAEGPSRVAETMNQRNFIFEPQVLAVRAGQTVRFTNDDPANHNVRTRDSNATNTFSINTGSGSVDPNTHLFVTTPPARPLELSCDIHPWMAAWIYVFHHDQFAVTNADGRFRIENVPAGRSRIAVRQPSGRLSQDLAADVRPGETTHLDVRFTSADVVMPQR